MIIQDGLRRMYGEQQEDISYYLTLVNEKTAHPAMPEGAEVGIRKGMYRFASETAGRTDNLRRRRQSNAQQWSARHRREYVKHSWGYL